MHFRLSPSTLQTSRRLIETDKGCRTSFSCRLKTKASLPYATQSCYIECAGIKTTNHKRLGIRSKRLCSRGCCERSSEKSKIFFLRITNTQHVSHRMQSARSRNVKTVFLSVPNLNKMTNR